MQLEYLISEKTNKETLLFVHGVGGNAGQFQKQHDFFSDHYKVFSKAVHAIPHMRYHLVNYDFTDFIRDCPIPFILIKCEYDTDINRALGTTLEAIFKNDKAKLLDLQGVGHLANLDNPEVFNQVLRQFLNGLSKEDLSDFKNLKGLKSH